MVGGHKHEQRRHRRRGRKVERQDRFTYHIHRVGLRVNAQGMNKLEPLFPRHCTVPETMNLPNCYRWRARGVADRGQLLCSFHFSASAVRAIGIWHPFPREGERERDEVRKWIEENVRAENRRQQNLSFSPLPPPLLLRQTSPPSRWLLFLLPKQKERLPSSLLLSFLGPSPNPISNFGFSSKFFRARNQSTN